ncbi:winged helix-turn-helix domain-containing protein [Marinobacterium rhizophilum]|uniref:Winged helix-turn-helix domain-containing protein n=1 Tax=Marinobacterium rhizophilum TaxID=420402 RepID=A0ABY5HGE3_9GAMM|nr:winged helix-turn-helix domain-containing protein [Marinobacterium rhizophilum]UTW11428.1 winged helix-turn-helix domain-containing protein [Marinobacterium rhizophilum]
MYKKDRRKSDIAVTLGLCRTSVGEWVNAYEKQGVAALNESGRGRPVGTGRSLTPAQEARIRRDIVDYTSDQLKMDFALRSAQAVRSLVQHYFSIDMPVRTVRSYLTRHGFTPQRPLKRAYEQKPEWVRQWMTEASPAIAERAKGEGAEIQWGGETAVFSVEHYPRGYTPKGKTPVLVLSKSIRERINLIDQQPSESQVHAV